jgi:hypothetical protein
MLLVAGSEGWVGIEPEGEGEGGSCCRHTSTVKTFRYTSQLESADMRRAAAAKWWQYCLRYASQRQEHSTSRSCRHTRADEAALPIETEGVVVGKRMRSKSGDGDTDSDPQ